MKNTLVVMLSEKQKNLFEKKFVEMNPIEVPEGLIEEQIKHMVIQAAKKEQQANNKSDLKLTRKMWL